MSCLKEGNRNLGRTRSRSSSFHTFACAVNVCPVWKLPPTAMLSSGVTTACGQPPGLQKKGIRNVKIRLKHAAHRLSFVPSFEGSAQRTAVIRGPNHVALARSMAVLLNLASTGKCKSAAMVSQQPRASPRLAISTPLRQKPFYPSLRSSKRPFSTFHSQLQANRNNRGPHSSVFFS